VEANLGKRKAEKQLKNPEIFMQDKIQKIILFGMVLTLTGCATNQRFDCKQSSGINCQSLSEIDRRVSTGQIGQNSKVRPKKSNSLYLTENIDEKNLTPSLSAKNNLRTKEEVAEIWVAAYETKEGVYHQPKTIHTVLKPAKWANSTNELVRE
jgi:hypothetical protein